LTSSKQVEGYALLLSVRLSVSLQDYQSWKKKRF